MNIFKKFSGLSLKYLYDEARLPAYKRKGLNCMLLSNVCGNLWCIVCGGGTTAMVGLAGYFGATDMEFGILVAIPQIAALLQIPFSMLVNRTHKRKLYILTYGLVSRAMWFLFGLMPLFFAKTSSYAMPVLMGGLAVSSALSSMINVCWFPWFSDIAPIGIRGRWMSFRDRLNSIGSLGFGMLSAYLLDVLPDGSKYLIIFIIGGLFGIIDMIAFGFVRDEWQGTGTNVRIRGMLGDVLKNKPFMLFTICWTVWNFTCNMSGSYLTPYSMNVMGLGFMQMTVFSTIASAVATVFMVGRWGKMMDRFGSKNVLILGCIGSSIALGFYVFSAPGSWWPVLLRNLFGALFWSGSGLAANGLQLSTSPAENRSTYIAVFCCVTSLVGTAFGTLCGGWFLNFCETNGLFTGWFDRYKALISLSVVLRLVGTAICVPPLMNDHEGTLKDAIMYVFRRKK